MIIKTNNVVGFSGVITNMASFNADFDDAGSRKTSKGEFYATHYKIKWLMRDYFARLNGEKSVLVKGKQFKGKDGKIIVQTLQQRIKHVFDLDDKAFKKLTSEELLNLALEKQDVKNFGIAIAEEGKSSKVTGVAQISYAVNNYHDTEEQSIQIGGAYASKEGAANNTIGRRQFVDFANYIYNFSVQPDMLSRNVIGLDVPDYTESDYNWFKKGVLRSVQSYRSSSSNSYTAYAMFIELKNKEDIIQTNFNDYISTEKVDDKYVVNFEKLSEFLKKNDESIESGELFLVDNMQLTFEGKDDLGDKVIIKDMSESRGIGLED